MSPFWIGFFEQLRRRGAWIFAIMLLAFFGLVLLISETGAGDFLIQWLPEASILIAAFGILIVALAIRQARARRKNRFKISPLSRDEMNKARSKLVRPKN